MKRSPTVFPSGEVWKRWTLFDGEREWEVNPLPADAFDLSTCGVPSPVLVRKRLQVGWTPADDVELYGAYIGPGTPSGATQAPDSSALQTSHHFIEMRSMKRAAELVTELERPYWEVLYEHVSGSRRWLVTVTAVGRRRELEQITATIEAAAAQHGGTYTGREVEV